MAMMRWWRLLSIMVLAACAWGCGTAQAQQGKPDHDCRSNGLKGSTVNAALQLKQHKYVTPRITSSMTVQVSRQWPLARYLTFSEESREYRQAMECLLRGDEKLGPPRNEWHPYEPVVTATGS